jgi:hypothetical protein
MAKNPLVPVFTLLLISVSITLSQCSASQTAGRNDLDSVALKALGKKYEMEFNESRSMVLCRQIIGDDHAGKTYKYIVIQLADHSVVHKGDYQYGYVKWVSDNSLEVSNRTMGSSDAPEGSNKKIIRLNTKQL